MVEVGDKVKIIGKRIRVKKDKYFGKIGIVIAKDVDPSNQRIRLLVQGNGLRGAMTKENLEGEIRNIVHDDKRFFYENLVEVIKE